MSQSSSDFPSLPEWVREYPFGLLLCALFLTILCAPLVSSLNTALPFLHGPARLLPFTTLLALSSTYAMWMRARRRAFPVFVVSLFAILVGVSSVVFHRTFIAAHLIAQTWFLGYLITITLRTVFGAKVIDGNILCGAAAVYLLVGVLFGYAFCFFEFLHPGSFVVTANNLNLPQSELIDGPGWLIYFSFSTLTTLSYGDILPATNLTRSVSVLEAVVGQMILVIMLARLVGLHVAHSTIPPQRPVRFEVGNESDEPRKD